MSSRERLGALHGDVEIPSSCISGVSVTDDAFAAVRGIRAPGTALPKTIAVGTWRRRGGRDFVAVHRHHAGAVVVDLEDAEYDRLVVSSDDPEGVAAAIRESL